MPVDGKFFLFCQDGGGISPSGLPFQLTATAANVVEVEPNDAQAQATAGVWPCAFNGIIDKSADIDHFKFAAKKGQVLDVHCYARRIGSQLDPLMYMGLMGQGAMVGNDDAVGPDSYFRVTIPQDGEYWISVTDHLRKGGPAYTYRIEITQVEAKLVLSAPPFSQFTQDRQAYAVRGEPVRHVRECRPGRFRRRRGDQGRRLAGKVTVATEADGREHVAGPDGLRGRPGRRSRPAVWCIREHTPTRTRRSSRHSTSGPTSSTVGPGSRCTASGTRPKRSSR